MLENQTVVAEVCTLTLKSLGYFGGWKDRGGGGMEGGHDRLLPFRSQPLLV